MLFLIKNSFISRIQKLILIKILKMMRMISKATQLYK